MKSNSFLPFLSKERRWLDSLNNPVLKVSVSPQNTFQSAGASWGKNVQDNLKKGTVSTFIQTKCAYKNISWLVYHTTSQFGALLQYVCNGVFVCAFVYSHSHCESHDSISSRTTQHFFHQTPLLKMLFICRFVGLFTKYYTVYFWLPIVPLCPCLSVGLRQFVLGICE